MDRRIDDLPVNIYEAEAGEAEALAEAAALDAGADTAAEAQAETAESAADDVSAAGETDAADADDAVDETAADAVDDAGYDDEDDDVKIVPVRVPVKEFDREPLEKSGSGSIFDGIDDLDENGYGSEAGSEYSGAADRHNANDHAGNAAGELEIEAVPMTPVPERKGQDRVAKRSSADRHGSRASGAGSGKNAGNKNGKNDKNARNKKNGKNGNKKGKKSGKNGSGSGRSAQKNSAAQKGSDSRYDERYDSSPVVGRHAVTTSRGVVYVESYSDDDYEIRKGVKSRVAKIIAALFIVALVAVAGIMFVKYCERTVAGDKVYNGITLNGKSVAGLTRDELLAYMNKTYVEPVSSSTIEVRAGDNSLVYPLNGIIKLPDTESLADEIYQYARSGNVVTRAFTVMGLRSEPKNYTLGYTVNESTINAITEKMNETNRAKVDPTYRVEDNQVVFTYGSNGLELSIDDIRDNLMSYTDSLLSSLTEGTATSSVSGTVSLVPRMTEFKKLLKINVVNDLPEKAVQARIERRSSTEVYVSPDTDGAYYDEALLDEILTRINSGEGEEGATEVLPLQRESTFFTKQFYESVIFRDVLGSASNVNEQEEQPDRAAKFANREKNITIAVTFLDGLVVMPGETFDFLTAIKASEARSGYVDAFENYNGFDSAAKGGGISQVSTALFNAVFLAGFQEYNKTKYAYAPNFGTLGFDAYTSMVIRVNFTFKNTSPLPIKLRASYADGKVSVQILGTVFVNDDFKDENGNMIDSSIIPDWVVIENNRPEKRLSAQVARTEKFTRYEFEDPTMFVGEERVTTPGIEGYTLNLYLIVRTNGKDDKQFLGVESYNSRNEMVMKGSAALPTEVPTEIPTEEPTEVPTDIPTEEPTETPDVTEGPTPEQPTPEQQTDVPEPTDVPDVTDVPDEPEATPQV